MAPVLAAKLSVQRQSVKLIGRLNPKLEQRLSPKDNLRQAIVDFDVKHGEEPILAVGITSSQVLCCCCLMHARLRVR